MFQLISFIFFNYCTESTKTCLLDDLDRRVSIFFFFLLCLLSQFKYVKARYEVLIKAQLTGFIHIDTLKWQLRATIWRCFEWETSQNRDVQIDEKVINIGIEYERRQINKPRYMLCSLMKAGVFFLSKRLLKFFCKFLFQIHFLLRLLLNFSSNDFVEWSRSSVVFVAILLIKNESKQNGRCLK